MARFLHIEISVDFEFEYSEKAKKFYLKEKQKNELTDKNNVL